MSSDRLRRQFREQGFAVLPGLLDRDQVQYYIVKLEQLSGISRSDFETGGACRHVNERMTTSWNLPDGVTKTAGFWPIIFNERLLETVRTLLGPQARFLQHTDLHVGFSAISWHRDNVNRIYGVGPDWDETASPYRLLRVGIYLQSFEESRFRLGFIKGSHRPGRVTLRRKLAEQKLKWLGLLSYISPKLQMMAAGASWIPTDPGDCILFDPRTLHSGSYIAGPKYSVFPKYQPLVI